MAEDLIGKTFDDRRTSWIVLSVVEGDAITLVGENRVFICRTTDINRDRVTTMDIDEVRSLIDITDRSYDGEWPVVLTQYLHGGKHPLDAELEELGVSNKLRHQFRYIVSEIGLTVELHANGQAFITHVNDVPLTDKVKCQ